jgi:anti-anti-sigma factor
MVAPAQQTRSSSGESVPATSAVSVEQRADVMHIVLVGEVDAESERELTRVGDEAVSGGLPVEIDCSAVTFMDSTGVSFLALLASRADAPVTVVDPPDIVRFLIDTTGIGPMLRVRDVSPDA